MQQPMTSSVRDLCVADPAPCAQCLYRMTVVIGPLSMGTAGIA